MPAWLRNILLTLVLAGAAGGSWLLRPAADRQARVPGAVPSQRGFYMRDAVFSGLDEGGEIVYRLAAARIEGTDDSEQMQFRDIEISYGQDSTSPWQITAGAARRPADTRVFELTDVVIRSTSNEQAEPLRIEADSLELEPDRQLARTDGPIRFFLGDSSIDAVGLNADLRNERFNLAGRIRGRVSP